jgi:hypothetical protein
MLRAGQLRDAISIGEPALRQARARGWGANFDATILAANIIEALIGLGRIVDAGQLLDPLTQEPPTRDDWPVHELRAQLDALRGRDQEAWDRLAIIREVAVTKLVHDLDIAQAGRGYRLVGASARGCRR